MPQRSDTSLRPVRRHAVNTFKPGECWGFDRFYPLAQLEREGFLHSENQSVSLSFSIRPKDFRVLYELERHKSLLLQRQVREHCAAIRLMMS